MVNTDEFVRRLERILSYYSMSAAAFADKIQVQRSSISHLLTGRNKPSLEFVLKVVKTFPEVNLYWLLNGKGSFPQKSTAAPTPGTKTKPKDEIPTTSDAKTIHKIIIFYEDGSFKAFDKNLDTL
ncbi:helix-turn-helix domain-containing protein [Muriicola sp. Z0-33]|uniref:helix-turn-helix domain-containing protein n=1 Tax=Muriicola sp. Z0-33 TaxID=2816957 RepID=UPI0022370A77|nr:helix-turn-helix transcriptional regulator [Muriicola sp. Z0-33]MCW5516686.1 helix-turn-helix transcriptional regulator [Muriicola sp. Z0-33]